MLKVGEVMKGKTPVTGHAVGRSRTRPMITAFATFGNIVRPWKRALVRAFMVIDVICIGILVWTNPEHLPLILVLPVITMMSGYEYLKNTARKGKSWWSK
jgi:hypothetical protein